MELGIGNGNNAEYDMYRSNLLLLHKISLIFRVIRIGEIFVTIRGCTLKLKTVLQGHKEWNTMKLSVNGIRCIGSNVEKVKI